MIEKDPSKVFVDYASGDYHLKDGSPAVDAGADTTAQVKTDIEGAARPQGKAVDIGAYEAR
jgi:hypothetical protein